MNIPGVEHLGGLSIITLSISVSSIDSDGTST